MASGNWKRRHPFSHVTPGPLSTVNSSKAQAHICVCDRGCVDQQRTMPTKPNRTARLQPGNARTHPGAPRPLASNPQAPAEVHCSTHPNLPAAVNKSGGGGVCALPSRQPRIIRDGTPRAPRPRHHSCPPRLRVAIPSTVRGAEARAARSDKGRGEPTAHEHAAGLDQLRLRLRVNNFMRGESSLEIYKAGKGYTAH